MSTITAKKKFVLTHPKDENGNDVKFSFMLTLDRQVQKVEEKLIKAIGSLPGIDSLNPNVGRYTIALTIARTFDPDEVIAELSRRLENDVLSEIIRPPSDLVTP